MSEEQADPTSTGMPNGSAAAALLASGIGTSLLGLSVVVAESSAGIGQVLNLVESVGPLSGKALVGVASWILSWVMLEKRWGGRQVEFRKVSALSLALILAGFLLTFPPIFQAIAG